MTLKRFMVRINHGVTVVGHGIWPDFMLHLVATAPTLKPHAA